MASDSETRIIRRRDAKGRRALKFEFDFDLAEALYNKDYLWEAVEGEPAREEE